jgi:integrase
MRAPGEGSVYQRKDGRWVGALRVAGKRYVVYGKTAQIAAQRLRELKNASPRGTLVAPQNLTVGAFFDLWIEQAGAQRRAKTVYGYQGLIRLYVNPRLGKLKLQKLAPLHLVQFYQQIGGTRQASKVSAMVRTALSDAVKWGLVSHNVAQQADAPKYHPPKAEIWTLEESQRFLGVAEASSRQAAPGLVLLMTCGLRASELLGLRWEDVDLSRRMMHITRAAVWTGGKAVFGPPKTRSGERTIILSAPALRALVLLQTRPRYERVFTTSPGGIPHLVWLGRTLAQLCQQADVPRLTLHQLRHQHASLLFAAGASVKEVQAQLGHSRASTTLDVYTHLLNRGNAELARRLDGLLRSPTDSIASSPESTSSCTTPDSES